MVVIGWVAELWKLFLKNRQDIFGWGVGEEEVVKPLHRRICHVVRPDPERKTKELGVLEMDDVTVFWRSQDIHHLLDVIGHLDTTVPRLAGWTTAITMHGHIVLILVARCGNGKSQSEMGTSFGGSSDIPGVFGTRLLAIIDFPFKVVAEFCDIVVLEILTLGTEVISREHKVEVVIGDSFVEVVSCTVGKSEVRRGTAFGVSGILATVGTSVILHLFTDCSEEGLKLLFVRILVWLKINLHTTNVFVVAEKLCCLLSKLPQLRVCQVVEVGIKITELTCIVIVVQLYHFPAVEAGIDEGDNLLNALGCGVGRRRLPVDGIVIRSEVASVFSGCPACCLGVPTFLGPEFYITTVSTQF